MVKHGPIRGCRDVLGAAATLRRNLINQFAAACTKHGFTEIEAPILERADLFSKTLGQTSDVVSSEMFHIAGSSPPAVLRPEGTAGVARALANVGLVKRTCANGVRVWYAGAMFRHERPQHLRLRQFTQLGVECIGDAHLSADVDCIALADGFLRAQLGDRVQLRVNSLGTRADRERYDGALLSFLKSRYWSMSELSRRRFDSGNCMRILDSKLAEDVDATMNAPPLAEFVGVRETARFEELQELLREAGVDFVVDGRLVRGLDYYTSTAFEFDCGGGKAVCAGGRYADVMGASGVGFAVGLERIEDETVWKGSEGVEAFDRCIEDGVAVVGFSKTAESSTCEVGRAARRILRELRKRDVKAVGRLEGSRLSKSVPRAIRGGARVVVVVGPKDVERGVAQVKEVRMIEGGGESSELVEVEVEKVAQFVGQVMERKK